MDDPFVSCPYDRSHRVPRSRLQAHLVRCERRGPPLAVCPYDATHRLPQAQLHAHVQDCEARLPFVELRPRKVLASLTTPKPTKQRDYLPENDPDNECWDD